MQKLNFIFPLFLILIFSSCYYTKTLVVEPEYEQKVALFPGKAIRVIITDQRMETTNKSLKIPGMSMAGDFDKISPVLSARHQTLIETHIKNQFTKLGEAYVVHCYVTKA